MTNLVQLPAQGDHVLRLYARLADVSACILTHAKTAEWELVAGYQAELVEVTRLLASVSEAEDRLDDMQRTSRILYLTAALADQREATECLAQQSADCKREAARLKAADRLQSYANVDALE